MGMKLPNKHLIHKIVHVKTERAFSVVEFDGYPTKVFSMDEPCDVVLPCIMEETVIENNPMIGDGKEWMWVIPLNLWPGDVTRYGSFAILHKIAVSIKDCEIIGRKVWKSTSSFRIVWKKGKKPPLPKVDT